MFKVPCISIGANLMTKYVDEKTLESDMTNASLVKPDGRCKAATRLDVNTEVTSKASVLLVMMLGIPPGA